MSTPEPESRFTVESFTTTWRRIVTDPLGFFADMPEAGGLGAPSTFLAICTAANALGHLITGWGVAASLAIFVAQLVGSYLAAALLVLVAQHLFAGRAGFEPTFRVVAYAAAPRAFLWVPLLGVLAWAYGAYLIVRGLERVQALDTTRAVLTTLLAVGVLWMLAAARTRGLLVL